MFKANYMRQTPTWDQVLESVKSNIRYNLNCIKIAIVEEFYPETMEVQCRIANKHLVGLNNDGSQITRDYPPIFARCHFFGWGDVGATYPITKGMEGFLLFNDRELESWFINGDVNPLKYERCHDLTDAIFICGLHSKPNLIDLVDACLHIYYKQAHLKLKEDTIEGSVSKGNFSLEEDKLKIEVDGETTLATSKFKISGDIEQQGNNSLSGTLTANTLNATSAYTGSFVDKNGHTVTVVNGIVTAVS